MLCFHWVLCCGLPDFRNECDAMPCALGINFAFLASKRIAEWETFITLEEPAAFLFFGAFFQPVTDIV